MKLNSFCKAHVIFSAKLIDSIKNFLHNSHLNLSVNNSVTTYPGTFPV